MKSFMKIHCHNPFFKILLASSVCFLMLLAVQEGYSADKVKPRFVIVLVDETESFAIYKNGKVEAMFWQEIIPCVVKVVQNLQPGEKFCVIGIDDHGFDTDDIRIPIQTLDEGILKAIQQKKEIIRKVKALERRKEKHRITDILGALQHTAYLLKKQDSYRDVVVIFSDMIQEPNLPTVKQASGLKFPGDTKVYCLYVNAIGQENWDKLINAWGLVFKSAGVNVSRDSNFYQRGEIDSNDFDRILSQ